MYTGTVKWTTPLIIQGVFKDFDRNYKIQGVFPALEKHFGFQGVFPISRRRGNPEWSTYASYNVCR